MPAPVPLPVRHAMRRRWEQGATTTELSRAFGVPPRTVRDLVRRWRSHPEAGVAPAYPRRPDPPPPPGHPAYGPAVLLRRGPPRRGAGGLPAYPPRPRGRPPPPPRPLNR